MSVRDNSNDGLKQQERLQQLERSIKHRSVNPKTLLADIWGIVEQISAMSFGSVDKSSYGSMAQTAISIRTMLQPIFAPTSEEALKLEALALKAENVELRKQLAERPTSSSSSDSRCDSSRRGHDCTLQAGHQGACSYPG